MPAAFHNPNLRRRALPGLLAWLGSAPLAPLLRLLPRKPVPGGPVTVFASYMVGDFFMALPALKMLNHALKKSGAPREVVVLCRADCLDLLAREGLAGLPFDNAFRIRPGFFSFVRSWRSARALRGRLGDVAIDLDADPRSALWLKVAGVARAISYRRAFGTLFDETFELPEPSVHQADRDLRIVEEFLKRDGIASASVAPSLFVPPAASAPWILSVWTRKREKNWPLDRWDLLLEKLVQAQVPFTVLEAPDGDAEFRAFQKRWSARAVFLRAPLTGVADAVGASAGVIATDNFLGHMAGYSGKPVVWVNRVSPAEQVEPRGPRTVAVSDAARAGGPTVEAVWAVLDTARR